MAARLLATFLLLILSTVAAAAEPRGLGDVKAQKAAVKCQKAIDQVGAKLAAGRLKSLDACSTAVLVCLQVKPGDAKCLQKATTKCSKALVDAIPRRGDLSLFESGDNGTGPYTIALSGGC